MSSRSCLELGVGLGERVVAACALFGGQLVEHRQVVEALAQLLDAAQLALGVGKLAGDLLGARLVVPQIGIGRLVLELLDAACADRRRRAPAPPWSGWSRVRRYRLDGRDPRRVHVTGVAVRMTSGTAGVRLASER